MWPVATRRFEQQVPWLLVYADLLASDGRCLESAEEIRKLHLAEEL
ncbi:MAG: type IV toxin-antitoxin system AbiEi family antitoxin [Lentisphaeria bacterium]|nr:hypothetical protein [Lentisphaerota bacterium]